MKIQELVRLTKLTTVGFPITNNIYTLGGPGIIVEIDESKFGKRKPHRGHRVEDVERTEERKVFVTTVPNRNAETMQNIIKRFVLPRSIIHADCWRAYNIIKRMEFGYTHYNVNHSVNFTEYHNGLQIHTNTIEGKLSWSSLLYKQLTNRINSNLGTWLGIKLRCFPRHFTRKNLPWKLVEFIWRRKHHGDIYAGMLDTFRGATFSRDRTDPEFTVYESYSARLRREQLNEQQLNEQQLNGQQNNGKQAEDDKDNQEKGEVEEAVEEGLEERQEGSVEGESVEPFTAFPHRRNYNLKSRRNGINNNDSFMLFTPSILLVLKQDFYN